MTRQEFEHIAHELRPRLLRIGRDFFGRDDLAEDVAQETLMRLWMLRERLDFQLGIEALAVRMAKNLCVSEWRKQKIRQGTPLQPDIPARENIHQAIELKEDLERLRRAIDRLTPTERRLFRMRYEAEMDIGQVTTLTGIAPRSVSAMLSAAKRKILEMLTTKKGDMI